MTRRPATGMADPAKKPQAFDPAEMGALAHLYRAEVYRSTVWRTRLDNTTNWAVVTTGIALSVSFSNVDASHLCRSSSSDCWSLCFSCLRTGDTATSTCTAREQPPDGNWALFRPILDGLGARAHDGWSDALQPQLSRCRGSRSVSPARMEERLRSNYPADTHHQGDLSPIMASSSSFRIRSPRLTSFGALRPSVRFQERSPSAPVSCFTPPGLVFAVLTFRRDQIDWNERALR